MPESALISLGAAFLFGRFSHKSPSPPLELDIHYCENYPISQLVLSLVCAGTFTYFILHS